MQENPQAFQQISLTPVPEGMMVQLRTGVMVINVLIPAELFEMGIKNWRNFKQAQDDQLRVITSLRRERHD